MVLGKQKPLKGRPGADLKPLNLERTRKKVEEEISRKVNDDDLLSYLTYPEVFKDYNKFRRQYGDVSVLPSSTYFYGLQLGEEITVDIEEGKTLYIKLINVSDADEEGVRTLTFELNGYPRSGDCRCIHERAGKGHCQSRSATTSMSARPSRASSRWPWASVPRWPRATSR